MKIGYDNISCLFFHEASVISIDERDGDMIIMLSDVTVKANSAANTSEARLNIPRMKITAEKGRTEKGSCSAETAAGSSWIDDMKTEISEDGRKMIFFGFGYDFETAFIFSFDDIVFEWEESTEYGIDYYYIGKKFYKNGEYEKAIEYCERSGALEPHYSVYELMYRCYIQLNDRDGAFESISRAYGLCGKNDRTAYEYAEMLYSYTGDREAALAVLEKVMARNKSCKAARELYDKLSI